jgi:hypothetical protein
MKREDFPGLSIVKKDDFPDLGMAATIKESKKDKKKKQTMSLAQFVAADSGAPRAFSARNDDALLQRLPTAPRGYVEGEERPGPGARLGGGFREYGGQRGGELEEGCWGPGKPAMWLH